MSKEITKPKRVMYYQGSKMSFQNTQINQRLTQKNQKKLLIMKPVTELFNRKGERVISKIKYKDFERQY